MTVVNFPVENKLVDFNDGQVAMLEQMGIVGSIDGGPLVGTHYEEAMFAVRDNPHLAVCDFCSDDPCVSYWLAEDFDTNDLVRAPSGSIGEWYACQTCDALIRTDQWRVLSKHSAAKFVEKHGRDPRDVDVLEPMLVELHKKVKDAMTGERVDLSAAAGAE